MIRRFGTPPKANQRYKVRAGAYAILPRRGQILLTWQGTPHNEVQLPGGGVDPGESAIRALHREVFEETGWHIAKPRRLGAFKRFTFMPDYDLWAEKVCHIYVATPTMRMGEPAETDHTAIWMSPEMAIRTLYNEGDASFLAGLL